MTKTKKKTNILTAVRKEELIDITKYSSLTKLERLTARFLYFVCVFVAKCKNLELPIWNSQDLEPGFLYWIRNTQQHHFEKEIADLKAGRNLSKNSVLTKCLPFLDKNEVLRMRGRLTFANLPPETKFPVILPGAAYFTELLIRFYQQQILHAGVNQTLNANREKYWITQGRQQVKKIVKSCVPCRKILSPCSKEWPLSLRIEYSWLTPFRSSGWTSLGPST